MSGSGFELLGGTSFDLDFTIFGQTFSEQDDVDYSNFPRLGVLDSVPFFLDFDVSETNPDNPTDIVLGSVLGFSMFDLSLDGRTLYGDVSVTYASQVATVPLPAALPLLASGLAGPGFMGWRRRKTQTS
ncbi:MAG: hypothetical protein EXQ91_00625 [Alphaproteobacteria bacterium]|nr:hypothetical protein [Alphaproteobacteria bacterium]